MSDWTIDTLKEYIEGCLASQQHSHDVAFASLKEAINAALASADRAVTKAETANEKRFASVNEFRDALADQQANLMTRSEVGVIANSLTEKVHALQKQLDAMVSERKGIAGGWGYAIGVVGFVIAILAIADRFIR